MDKLNKTKKEKYIDKEKQSKEKNIFHNFGINNLFFEENEEKKLIGHKREKSEPLKENELKIEANDKKSMSEENKKSKYSNLFIFNKESNFEEIYKYWKNNIKSIKINNSGDIINKLADEELIFKTCKMFAINKLKLNSYNNIEDIYNILSYNNIDKFIIYKCFKKIKDIDNLLFKEALLEYKYCFCDENIIINYLNNNEKLKINLYKEFNFKFPFKNINEGIDTLKETIKYMIELTDKFYDYYLNNKKSKTEINLIFKYNENIGIIHEQSNNDLFNLGYQFLKNYLLIKDFDKFNSNQPFSYQNNDILYISFLLNEIYKHIIEVKENTIIIMGDYFKLIYNLYPVLDSIILDLDKYNINIEFCYKIRFFNILFQINISHKSFDVINYDFIQHIFDNNDNLKNVDIQEIIKIKEAKDKISRKKIKYKYINDILEIYFLDNSITINVNDYHKSFKDILLSSEVILRYTWEKNSILSFQNHNFLLNEDILFLKNILNKYLNPYSGNK